MQPTAWPPSCVKQRANKNHTKRSRGSTLEETHMQQVTPCRWHNATSRYSHHQQPFPPWAPMYIPARAGRAGTSRCPWPSDSAGRSCSSQSGEWEVQARILCSGLLAAPVLGSLLPFRSVQLEAFDGKMIIWLLFVLLQLLPYFFYSPTFILFEPLLFKLPAEPILHRFLPGWSELSLDFFAWLSSIWDCSLVHLPALPTSTGF